MRRRYDCFDSITRMGRSMDETLKEYRWFVENGINLELLKEPTINTNSKTKTLPKEWSNKDCRIYESCWNEKITFV
jgi:hypothetical protein